MIICDYLFWLFDKFWWLFINSLLIIWWLFHDCSVTIWWLFDDYLMIIWLSFDDYLILFDDYLMTIRDYLMPNWWLFDHNYSWLFDDYSISTQQQVVWFASFPKAFIGNRGSSGWWQPFPWAYCSLRVSLATCCRSYASSATTILSFMAVSTSLAPCGPCPPPPAASGWASFCKR